MKPVIGNLRLLIITIVLTVATVQQAQGHLMVAQQGTLNVVNNGAFIVLSLPVSGFEGIDDDGDKRLSMQEFQAYRSTIINSIINRVRLKDEKGFRPLEGIMLSPATNHDSPDTPSAQLIVMGRFALNTHRSATQFEINFFGTELDEQMIKLTVSGLSDHRNQLYELTPLQSSLQLFVSQE